jgi:2-dehydro-3-deoxygalactonokinase
MDKFLSCDWGTSSFRLRLVQAPALSTIAAVRAGSGIAATWQAWQSTGLEGPLQRWRFYVNQIKPAIQSIEQQAGPLTEQIPLIISGMASSSIGMMELPYGSLPFATDGRGVLTHQEPASADLPHDVLLISGIRSTDDVMRGEETQLIGCMAGNANVATEGTFIFPGTHSKHIQVKDGAAIGFQTFMTGELFDLLRRHSILKDAVAVPEGPSQPVLSNSFSEGVTAGAAGNLLHSAFRVRTNQLFAHLTKTENLDYLSGLLIGAELQSLLIEAPGHIYLCGGAHLEKQYATALDVLGLTPRSTVLAAQWIEEAVIRGQYSIFTHLNVQHHA